MIVRRMTLAALSIALLTFSANFASAEDVIAKFEGLSTGKGQSAIGAKVMATGRSVVIAIPNVDSRVKNEAPMPKKELYDAAKNFKSGDIVKLGFELVKNSPVLTSIEKYDAKPGEETTNGYVFSKTFDKTVGKTTTTLLVLTKFGKEYQFGIPTKKAENGTVEQDPAIVAAIGKLQEGNAVWIQTQGKNISAIEPYTDPKIGKLVKVSKTEVSGHEVPSAEVEDEGGKAVTLLVPGKESGKAWVPDAVVNGQLHNKVRPGAMVEYRVHEDGDKLWLLEIGAAPKTAKPTPDKEMAKEAPKKK